MDGAAGEADGAALRVAFDHRLKLEFHGSRVTSDAGLLPFRDLDGALGLTDLAGEVLARGLRVPGSGRVCLCDPPARQCGPSTEEPAESARRNHAPHTASWSNQAALV